MSHGSIPIIVLLVFAAATQQSFVDAAPTDSTQKGSPEIVPETLDANVRELESLKQTIGKTLEMMKTHSSVYTDTNGHKELHSDSRSQVKEDGKVVGSVKQRLDSETPADPNGKQSSGTLRTELDVPAKGLHKSLVEQLAPEYTQQLTENGNRRTPGYDSVQEANTLEKYETYSNTKYSPLEMAEYVFWTGDEKGVTLTIEEFLKEGYMSREEAISLLQEIKYNLDYLQSHYTQLGLNARDHSKEANNNNAPITVEQLTKPRQTAVRPELKNNFDISKLRQQQTKKNSDLIPEAVYRKENDVSVSKEEPRAAQSQQEEDYDELLERLRVADFLYTEYSLEEVIYQLAKVMFTQSLTRGSAEAQQALQKFTTFLETEAEQGQISRSLEKKVLDVLIASLTDTLNEHPELAPGATHTPSIDGPSILRQILQMSPEDKASIKANLNPFKDQNERNIATLQDLRSPIEIQLKDKNHVPIGFGKYKTIR